MTQRLSVSGTPDLSPDCTTPDTGPPAGVHNGKDYWEWVTGTTTWRLHWRTQGFWQIGPLLDGNIFWFLGSETPSGDYTPFASGTLGTATVAEPEPEKLLVLEWLTGPHAGKHTLLKESL
jgi:hypothetical protein